MQLLDEDILATRALVVDASPTARTVLCAQLRDFGIAQVHQTARVQDARQRLEDQSFDFIFCDYHFEPGEMSGQDLLDDLRRAQLLPYSCVFVIVTSEATYASVAEAAESGPDVYLLRPYTASDLAERLQEARRRKRAMDGIYGAIRHADYERAAALCWARFEQKQAYTMFAARIGAELYLKLGHTRQALHLYEAAHKHRPLPWTRVGIARCQMAAGNLPAARATLAKLIAEHPEHADAHDVLARVQIEQGEFAEALATSLHVARLTPGSVTRVQQAGTMAYYAGEVGHAARLLERASVAGMRSRLFDPHALLLLALLRFDSRDGKGLAQCETQIGRLAERSDPAPRLRRLVQVIRSLKLLREGAREEAFATADGLMAELDDPDYDMEAACDLTSLWMRLHSNDVPFQDIEPRLQRIAQRCCVSRSAAEWLLGAVKGHEAAEALIRTAQAALSSISERAMSQALKGQARGAVELLLDEGLATGNARLIELANLVAHRHREKLGDGPDLIERTQQLKQRYCRQLGSSLGLHQNGRSAGGLMLRA